MSAEKLEKLANTKFELKAAKATMLEKLDGQLTFAYAGGLFKSTPELLALLDAYEKQNYTTVVIMDEYQNPIMISEVELFTQMVAQNLQAALNEYFVEYERLKKVRKGENL